MFPNGQVSPNLVTLLVSRIFEREKRAKSEQKADKNLTAVEGQAR
jgi:hypothetical protein